MADQEHVERLQQGKDVWNAWRTLHPEVNIDLSGADLSGATLIDANLSGADLSGADLSGAILTGAFLSEADLSKAILYRATLIATNLSRANLSRACLIDANLYRATLSDANLSRANLSRADLSDAYLSRATLTGATLSEATLSDADLSRADLSDAYLSRATLVDTNLTRTTLTQCTIYGISVWNAQLDGAKQENLIITNHNEPTITVDNLEVAQFIYLLLNNAKIRDVINTITTKVVLILGRFNPDRKAILDALRETLRQQNYLPVLFDFEKPSSRNYTETIGTLAHLAHFIIADLTEPSSIPQELQAIIPNLAVPIQPVLLEGKREYAMFVDFLKTYDWVLPVHFYKDQTSLLASLKEQVIVPAEQKAKDLERKRM